MNSKPANRVCELSSPSYPLFSGKNKNSQQLYHRNRPLIRNDVSQAQKASAYSRLYPATKAAINEPGDTSNNNAGTAINIAGNGGNEKLLSFAEFCNNILAEQATPGFMPSNNVGITQMWHTRTSNTQTRNQISCLRTVTNYP